MNLIISKVHIKNKYFIYLNSVIYLNQRDFSFIIMLIFLWQKLWGQRRIWKVETEILKDLEEILEDLKEKDLVVLTEEVVDMEAIQVVDLDQETILDLGQEKCIKQHVQNVVKNVKYHSNHQEKDLFIAKNVFKSVDQKGFDSYFF